MARNCMLQRELKRKKMVEKYSMRRFALKKIILDINAQKDDKWQAQLQLQKLPVNSSPSRLQHRCAITGRARGVYKKFGLCRNKLREHAMLGDLPGLKKASW